MQQSKQMWGFLSLAILLATLPFLTGISSAEPPTASPPPIESTMPPAPPLDEGPEEPLILCSAEELQDWMEESTEKGGEAYLGADIDWPYDYWNKSNAKLSIHAGEHTITLLPGSAWEILGALTVDGGATVFRVSEGATLYLPDEGGIFACGDTSIAVALQGPDGLRVSAESQAVISAEGLGAAAISAPGGLTLKYATILASGGAVALESGNAVDLTLCTLIADSEAPAIYSSGTVLLDTCSVSPEYPSAVCLTRRLEPNCEYDFFYSVGSVPVLPEMVSLRLVVENREDIVMAGPAKWVSPEVDISREGVYTARGDVNLSFRGIQLQAEVSCTFYLFDGTKPRFAAVTLFPNTMILHLYKTATAYSPRLQVYQDEEHVWVDWANADFNCLGGKFIGAAVHGPFTPGRAYRFRAIDMDEAGNYIYSNIVTVTLGDDVTVIFSPGDGDWDGGDFDEQTPKPPPFTPSYPTPPFVENNTAQTDPTPTPAVEETPGPLPEATAAPEHDPEPLTPADDTAVEAEVKAPQPTVDISPLESAPIHSRAVAPLQDSSSAPTNSEPAPSQTPIHSAAVITPPSTSIEPLLTPAPSASVAQVEIKTHVLQIVSLPAVIGVTVAVALLLRNFQRRREK